MMGQKMEKPCGDCVDGRCDMNCGPAVVRQHDLAADSKRRQSAKEAKQMDRARQLLLLHKYVSMAQRLMVILQNYTEAMEWRYMPDEQLEMEALTIAIFHYGRLAQKIGESTYPACRAAWKEYLK